MSPSPMNTQPRMFHEGIVFNSRTYEQILSSVYESKNMKGMEEDDDEQSLNEILNQARALEIECLSQSVIRERPMHRCEVADTLIELLNNLVDNTGSSMIKSDDIDSEESSKMIVSTHPYPPINQTGLVVDHDRPYADYGHLSMSYYDVVLNIIKKI
jgi:hypothetical protein